MEITVEDQGPGIAEADLPRVFEPYYRAAGASACGRRASRLGLAVVKSLVDAHGGEIRAENMAPRHQDDADHSRRSLTLRVGGV